VRKAIAFRTLTSATPLAALLKPFLLHRVVINPDFERLGPASGLKVK
jgi:hypothetical protein